MNFDHQPVVVGIPSQFAICEVKRLIGMKYDDPKVKELIYRNTWPFDIVEGENGYAAIQMYSTLTQKEEIMMPEMISAIVLKEIHIELQRNLGIAEDQIATYSLRTKLCYLCIWNGKCTRWILYCI